MAEPITLEQVAQMVGQLPLADKVLLAEQILRNVAPQVEVKPRRKWREIRGRVKYPYFLEDAQAWVTRTRKEADERREKLWRRTP